MNDKLFTALGALTELDDALIAEAADVKMASYSIIKRLVIPAAAAAVIVAAALVTAKLVKKPNGKEAFLTPFLTEPSSTEFIAEPTEELEPFTPEPTQANDIETTSLPMTDYSPLPSSTVEATSSSEGSPEATPAATPMSTPAPTAEPTAEPTSNPTPQPTSSTTSEPVMETLTYYSLADFVSAVRAQEHWLLNNIDCYYTLRGAPEGSVLNSIVVNLDTVDYNYSIAGKDFVFSWMRDINASRAYYYSLINNNNGNWHDELYVFLSQAGKYYAVRMDNEHLLRFRYAGDCTEDEMVSYCRVIRYAL